jgi:hypothetical protein
MRRHAQVEQRDVGPMPLECGDGLDAVGRLRDDEEILLLIDDVGHARAQQRVVVHQEDAEASRRCDDFDRVHVSWRLRSPAAPRRAPLRYRRAEPSRWSVTRRCDRRALAC